MSDSAGDPLADAFAKALPRPEPSAKAAAKKNYAERLSRAIASCLANELRPSFPGILPDKDGKRQESKAPTAKGYKKLDVNYSTVELGLALGVSVKTLNFPDAVNRRFTKNFTRVDNELRAEAMDYHVRQPFSVLVGILFLPVDSCDDAGRGSRVERGISSLGRAVQVFRQRANRSDPGDLPDLFERFFIGLYDVDTGQTRFIDVMNRPPRSRRPTQDESLGLAGLVTQIVRTYSDRNNPAFEWAD